MCPKHPPLLFWAQHARDGRMVTKAMRRAQEIYFCNLGRKLKSNPKEVWRYVKNKSNSTSTIPDIMDGRNYESNTETKAEDFNTYFQSCFRSQLIHVGFGRVLARSRKRTR